MSVAEWGVTTVRANAVALALEPGAATLVFAAGGGNGRVPAHAATRHETDRANTEARKLDKRRECLLSVSRSPSDLTHCGNLNRSDNEHCFSRISTKNTHLQRGL